MPPVAARHHETRQYFIKHNTLVDVQALMQREHDIMDKIHAAIDEQGLGTDAARKNLQATLTAVIDGVKAGRAAVSSVQFLGGRCLAN